MKTVKIIAKAILFLGFATSIVIALNMVRDSIILKAYDKLFPSETDKSGESEKSDTGQ